MNATELYNSYTSLDEKEKIKFQMLLKCNESELLIIRNKLRNNLAEMVSNIKQKNGEPYISKHWIDENILCN